MCHLAMKLLKCFILHLSVFAILPAKLNKQLIQDNLKFQFAGACSTGLAGDRTDCCVSQIVPQCKVNGRLYSDVPVPRCWTNGLHNAAEVAPALSLFSQHGSLQRKRLTYCHACAICHH